MASRRFDTYFDGADQPLVEFLRSVHDGRIVVLAIKDEGSFHLSGPARAAIAARLGCASVRRLLCGSELGHSLLLHTHLASVARPEPLMRGGSDRVRRSAGWPGAMRGPLLDAPLAEQQLLIAMRIVTTPARALARRTAHHHRWIAGPNRWSSSFGAWRASGGRLCLYGLHHAESVHCIDDNTAIANAAPHVTSMTATRMVMMSGTNGTTP